MRPPHAEDGTHAEDGPRDASRRALERDREGTVERPDQAVSRRFRRGDRLLDGRDFRRVLRFGRRAAHPELVVVVAPRQGAPVRRRREAPRPGAPRLGLTVGRKAGPAVARNRFKRRVRDWFRTRREQIGGELDVIVIARAAGIDLAGPALAARLESLLGAARRRLEEGPRGRRQGRTPGETR